MLKSLHLRLSQLQDQLQYQPVAEEDQASSSDDVENSLISPQRGAARGEGLISEKMSSSHGEGMNELLAQSHQPASLSSIVSATGLYSRRRRSFLSTGIVAAVSFTILLLILYGLPHLSTGNKLHRDSGNEPALFYTPPGKQDVDPNTGEPVRRKAIVIASYTNQDVRWLRDLARIDNTWEVYRYVSDLHPEDHTPEEFPDIETLNVPQSDGREALAYLTFIIDKYFKLPDYTFFIHGHRYSWHQPAHIVDMLTAFNVTALDDEGYISLRCQRNHGCTKESMYHFTHRGYGRAENRKGGELPIYWNDFLEEELGKMPDAIGRPCCAQFGVHKSAIRGRTRKFWSQLRKPLTTTENWKGYEKRGIGLFLEMVWHVLFGKPPLHCPPAGLCEKAYFQDKIKCECDGVEPCRVNDTNYVGWKHLNCTNSLRDFPLDTERWWMQERYTTPPT